MKKYLLQYLLRAAAWVSQGIHCFFLFGHHDMTVSARCHVEYRLLGNQRWRWAHDTINAVFLRVFGQEEHCRESFASDQEFAKQVLELSGDRRPAASQQVSS